MTLIPSLVLAAGLILLWLPGCFAADGVSLVEQWSVKLPGTCTNHRVAGTGVGDLNHDLVGDVAVILPLRDAARLFIVSGADGSILTGPVDLKDPGLHPNPGDPSIAATLDRAAPQRSQLFVGMPYANARRGVVLALELTTLSQRYFVEGDGRQRFGSTLSAGADWDADGWLDFAIVADGLGGKEGQRITDGFVSVRSGATGAEIIKVADGCPTIGAACRLAGIDKSNRLLVASFGGTQEQPTQLTAYELPAGTQSWTSAIADSGVPQTATPAHSESSGPGAMLVGVPFPGHMDATDHWVQHRGHVLVASNDDGRILRKLEGPGYGFGTSVVGCSDFTGDGIGELLVATWGAWLDVDVIEPLSLIDGASGDRLCALSPRPRFENWGTVLVATDQSGSARTFVTSVFRSDVVELRGLRLEGTAAVGPTPK